jgi:hypothetical protein
VGKCKKALRRSQVLVGRRDEMITFGTSGCLTSERKKEEESCADLEERTGCSWTSRRLS